MNKDYSVEDILKEFEGKKAEKVNTDDEFSKIMEELTGKKATPVMHFDKQNPIKPLPEKNEEPKKEEINKEEPKVIEEHVPEAKVEETTITIDKIERKKENLISSDTITFDSNKIKEKKDFTVKINYDKEESDKELVEASNQSGIDGNTIQIEPFGISEEKLELKSQTESVNQDLIEFRENRKKKVEKFVLFGEDEEENDPEQEVVSEETDEVKTLEDFNDYSESTAIIKDLSGIKAGLTLRAIVLIILGVACAYIELGRKIGIPVIDILNKETQPISYLIISALIFVAAVLVSAPAVFGGFSSLFKFKADGDSILAVSVLGCVVQYVSLFISPLYVSTARNTICVYSLIAILNMLFNTIGKLLIIRRVRLNFRFVSGGYEKYAVSFPESEKINTFVKEEFDANYAGVAVPKKTDFIGGFLGYSYKEDASDNISKVLSPIISVGALVLCVLSFVFMRDFQKAASVFAAVTSISTPISVMLVVNYPLFKTVKKLISRGSMISSLAACNEVYDTNAIIVKSADLFPKGSIQLSAIKTFAAGKIDDVIIDAASVVVKAQSDLSDVFLKVIGGRKELLRQVDSIVYEESMGLSAWVESKRVLIGNRDLIANHAIPVPSKDYEDRYLDSGMDMVYLAQSGELIAVFLIQYKPGKQIKRAMKALKNIGVGVIVASTDPNINDRKIAKIFDVDKDMIRTVPADKQSLAQGVMKQSSRETVGCASISSFSAFAQTIYAAIRLKGIISLAVVLQTIGAIIGFAITAFFTVVSGSISIPVEAILLYQLFWLFASLIVPMFRNVKI